MFYKPVLYGINAFYSHKLQFKHKNKNKSILKGNYGLSGNNYRSATLS